MTTTPDDTTPTPVAPRRRVPIAVKLLAGLAVPVLFVAILSAIQVKRAQNELNRTRQETKLALAIGGPGEYITALMDERNVTALDLLGTIDTVKTSRIDTVDEGRALTDAAAETFAEALESGGSEVQRIYGPRFDNAQERLAGARRLYDDFTGTKGPFEEPAQERARDAYDEYNDFIVGFDDANAEVISRIDDGQLRGAAVSISQQTIASNLLSVLSRRAAQVILDQAPLDEDKRLEIADLYRQYQRSETDATLGLQGNPEAQAVVEGYFGKEKITEIFKPNIEQLETDGYIGPESVIDSDGNLDIGAAVPLITETMEAAGDPTEPNSTTVWESGREALQHRADALISAAQRTRNIYVAVFLIATLVSLALASLVARSIARPLLSIASQAEDMATRRLPEAVGSVLATPLGQDVVEPEVPPIVVDSGGEIASVATSINVVQQRALDLAVDQAAQRRNFADTFLNLGRRVQGLVARQLEFITQLEDAEDDPDVLADLFRLDHLATRIRRNAESLVVLTGVTRRQRRGEPAPVIDALRSALSEVDEYTRVDIGDVDHARLPMTVAADVAHILAELIENGLNFSPPDADVLVTGRRSDSGYDITVTDHGIGMDADQIDTANRRLSGEESFTVAPSRYMGHYVAGRLATALGIEVTLASTGNGTRAVVSIPANRLVTRDDTKFDGPATRTTGSADSGVQAAPWPTGSSTPPTAESSPEGEPDAAHDADSDVDGADSLSNLLSVHRRLSRSTASDTPDRSPWARRPGGEEGAGGDDADEADDTAD